MLMNESGCISSDYDDEKETSIVNHTAFKERLHPLTINLLINL